MMYTVHPAVGEIFPKKCVDIAVRHLGTLPHNWGTKDMFRFQIFEIGSKNVLGQKDVPVILHKGPLHEKAGSNLSVRMVKGSSGYVGREEAWIEEIYQEQYRSAGFYWSCIIAIYCLVILVMPLSTDQEEA